MNDKQKTEYLNMKIADMPQEHRDFLDNELAKYSSEFADVSRKLGSEANSTERSLSGQLMLITTVITTISVVALGNPELMKHLVDVHKYLILLIFFLQIVSITSGIINYLKIEEFFAKSAKEYMSALDITNAREFKTLAEYYRDVGKALKDREWQAKRPALYVQIVSIALSLVVYGVLIAIILFGVPT